ncbi:MAG: hypothetical protein KJN93_00095, partial [Alphaproteobacteria bacterium]|nr:hypothetical protein [Alphaproteobacteria bacterium]
PIETLLFRLEEWIWGRIKAIKRLNICFRRRCCGPALEWWTIARSTSWFSMRVGTCQPTKLKRVFSRSVSFSAARPGNSEKRAPPGPASFRIARIATRTARYFQIGMPVTPVLPAGGVLLSTFASSSIAQLSDWGVERVGRSRLFCKSRDACSMPRLPAQL